MEIIKNQVIIDMRSSCGDNALGWKLRKIWAKAREGLCVIIRCGQKNEMTQT
jgi:hypothetical protein